MKDVQLVYNYETAIHAIQTIIGEGEGTSVLDIYDGNGVLSHYHKLLEIVKGKRILGI